MSEWIKIENKSQAEAAIKANPNAWLDIVKGRFTLEIKSGRVSIRVAVGVDVCVVAMGSSSVVAMESSSVVARGSSSVEARGNVFLRLFSAASIKLSPSVTVVRHKNNIDCGPAFMREALEITSPESWCEFYGIDVVDGVATLFKGVDDDFSTDRARAKGIFYRPGAAPHAPDWDGGEEECGGGLHLSPSVGHTLEFHSSATRWVACDIALEDMAVHPNGQSPQKVKVKRIIAIREVTRDGKLVEAE